MSNMTLPQSNAMQADPMDWLFGEFHAQFGNPFLDKFRSGHVADGKDTGIENMKATWAEKIRSNGLRMAEIKRGIKGLERCKYGAPTWGEFLELCRPTPNVDDAISEALVQWQARREGRDVWSHPVIYWAALSVGYYELNNLSRDRLRPMFASAMAKILAGDVPPVPPMKPDPAALPAPQQKPFDLDDAKERLAQVKAQDVLKHVNDAFDHLSWAKRIVEREKTNPANVSLHQLKEARLALRME